MLFTKVLFAVCVAVLTSARAAPEPRDSPRGTVYEANFRQHGNIRGFVRFYSVNGVVRYVINVRGLPRQGGPFMYHVHQRRVPENGDCTATLGHFNPYNGVLNAPTPAEFEVGDLSGKHGLIRGTSYRRTIEDLYASLNPQNMAFIGDLSVVIHLDDGTRIACANLVRERGGNQKRFGAKFAYRDEMPESMEEEMFEQGMDPEGMKLGKESRENIDSGSEMNEGFGLNEEPSPIDQEEGNHHPHHDPYTQPGPYPSPDVNGNF